MTATIQARVVITSAASGAPTCPPWCGSHPLPNRIDGAHELDLAQEWGNAARTPGEERLSLALERFDDEGTRGEPKIVVQYSKDGEFPGGFIELPLSVAKSFMHTMGWLINQAEGY